MPYYKDAVGALYFIESDEFRGLLPGDCQQITDDEASALMPSANPHVPTYVTMRQARLALLQQGRLAAVNAAVSAADEATQIEWEFAQGVDRSSPIVEAVSSALGLTPDDLDALFTLAASFQ